MQYRFALASVPRNSRHRLLRNPLAYSATAFREQGSLLPAGTVQSWDLVSLSSTANPVPEPATALLSGAGLAVLGLLRGRRRAQRGGGDG